MKPLLSDQEHAAWTASGCVSLTCYTVRGRFRLVVPMPTSAALVERLKAAGFEERSVRTGSGPWSQVLVLDRPALPTSERAMQRTAGDA